MTDDALTLTVLREIRDAVLATNGRLDETNSRLDETNSRLDQTRVELSTRLGHLETVIGDLAEQQAFVVQWLKAGTRRDRRLEKDLIKLTGRVDAMEARLPTTEE